MMDQFGQVIIVDLLYSIPVLIFGGIMFGLSFVTTLNIFIVFLLIPLLSPFTAGLFYCAGRVTLKEKLSAVRDFKKGMKTEWKPFVINSLAAYVITCGIYITMQIYRGGLSNPVILTSFIMSTIFVLFFVCFENAFLTMLVTVDIRPSQAVKNAVLMFIGGLLYHLKAIISLVLVIFVISSVFILIGDPLIAMLALLIPCAVVLPMLWANIIVYNVFQTVEKHVVVSKTEEKEEKQTVEAGEDQYSELSYEELMQYVKGDPEEYVYIGGRMLKRKTIIQMAQEMQP